MSFVNYSFVSCSGLIASVGDERELYFCDFLYLLSGFF